MLTHEELRIIETHAKLSLWSTTVPKLKLLELLRVYRAVQSGELMPKLAEGWEWVVSPKAGAWPLYDEQDLAAAPELEKP